MGVVHEIFVQARAFVLNWWPLLVMGFYAALIYLFWRILQVMPRVKPSSVDAHENTQIS